MFMVKAILAMVDMEGAEGMEVDVDTGAAMVEEEQDCIRCWVWLD